MNAIGVRGAIDEGQNWRERRRLRMEARRRRFRTDITDKQHTEKTRTTRCFKHIIC